ncbi:MAG: hypothetical protein GX589_02385 [Deltaproteobacteria bacterium]|nr:hypothetical protein [Deltaproteobacteria bacterium]
MDSKFNASDTFFDFSNTPMLYYYLQRRVPSYFNQIPICLVSDYLEREQIRHLRSLHVPLVVFQHWPRIPFDTLDGIPNTVRHGRLANCIYRNFRPYGHVNGLEVWARRTHRIKPAVDQAASLKDALAPRGYILNKLPYVLAKKAEAEQRELVNIQTWNKAEIEGPKLDLPLKKKKKLMAKAQGARVWFFLKLRSTSQPVNYRVSYSSDRQEEGVYRAVVPENKGPTSHLIPISSQYNWHRRRIKHITVQSSIGTRFMEDAALVVFGDEMNQACF